MRCLLVFLCFGFICALSRAHDLKVNFQGLRSREGQILYLLFNKDVDYPDKAELSFRQGKIEAPEALSAGILLKDIPEGDYAMTFIHDENQNAVLDTNFLGIPREGFGFSNNPTVFFGPPSYGRSVFSVLGTTELTINMKYF